MTNAEKLAAMEAVLVAVGLDPNGPGVHYDIMPSGGAVSVFARTATIDAARFVATLGEPTRDGGDKKVANWRPKSTDTRFFRVTVFDWPWPTCGECGQAVGEKVTA